MSSRNAQRAMAQRAKFDRATRNAQNGAKRFCALRVARVAPLRVARFLEILRVAPLRVARFLEILRVARFLEILRVAPLRHTFSALRAGDSGRS